LLRICVSVRGMLAKNAGFTLIAVFTLLWALAPQRQSSASCMAFSCARFPTPSPIDLQLGSQREGHRVNFTEPNFSDLRALPKASKASLNAMRDFYNNGRLEPTRTLAQWFTGFLKVMGVSPLFGRGFHAEDQREGARAVCWLALAIGSIPGRPQRISRSSALQRITKFFSRRGNAARIPLP